ncbi:hypothetical protein [Mesorhizobium caraganae]|uniref:hypothetical protein n=1 Tax=Mesorhizobium caraganae TaxID=483206 RepID=UPI00177AEB6E|nr:hypothetical protein [Mesorhizobium caraganae]
MSALLMPPHHRRPAVDRLLPNLDQLQPAVARRDQQRASRKAALSSHPPIYDQLAQCFEDGDCGFVIRSGH